MLISTVYYTYHSRDLIFARSSSRIYLQDFIFIFTIFHILFYNPFIKNYWRGLHFLNMMPSRIYVKIKSSQMKSVLQNFILWNVFACCLLFSGFLYQVPNHGIIYLQEISQKLNIKDKGIKDSLQQLFYIVTQWLLARYKIFKEWVSFFLGSWGMNRVGQTNRMNREAVLMRFVCSALQWRKMNSFLIFTIPQTKTLSKILWEKF